MLILWPDLLISASFLRKARSEEDMVRPGEARRAAEKRLKLSCQCADTAAWSANYIVAAQGQGGK